MMMAPTEVKMMMTPTPTNRPNRQKVILRDTENYYDNHNLSLTEDQVNIINWLKDHDIICENWEIEILSNDIEWEVI